MTDFPSAALVGLTRKHSISAAHTSGTVVKVPILQNFRKRWCQNFLGPATGHEYTAPLTVEASDNKTSELVSNDRLCPGLCFHNLAPPTMENRFSDQAWSSGRRVARDRAPSSAVPIFPDIWMRGRVASSGKRRRRTAPDSASPGFAPRAGGTPRGRAPSAEARRSASRAS
jgi:hypothetical protein